METMVSLISFNSSKVKSVYLSNFSIGKPSVSIETPISTQSKYSEKVFSFKAANLITILMFSFSLRAAGVFIPYLFGNYTKKKLSAVASMGSLIAGSVVTIFFQYNKNINLFGVDPIIPGIVASLIVFLILSSIIQPKPDAKTIN